MEDTEKPNFQTYLEVAQKLIDENPDFYDEKGKEGVLSFGKYLDSFKVLGNELQMLAMQQARKIDREFILECIEEFGKDAVAVVARRVNDRHRHHKVAVRNIKQGNEATEKDLK